MEPGCNSIVNNMMSPSAYLPTEPYMTHLPGMRNEALPKMQDTPNALLQLAQMCSSELQAVSNFDTQLERDGFCTAPSHNSAKLPIITPLDNNNWIKPGAGATDCLHPKKDFYKRFESEQRVLQTPKEDDDVTLECGELLSDAPSPAQPTSARENWVTDALRPDAIVAKPTADHVVQHVFAKEKEFTPQQITLSSNRPLRNTPTSMYEKIIAAKIQEKLQQQNQGMLFRKELGQPHDPILPPATKMEIVAHPHNNAKLPSQTNSFPPSRSKQTTPKRTAFNDGAKVISKPRVTNTGRRRSSGRQKGKRSHVVRSMKRSNRGQKYKDLVNQGLLNTRKRENSTSPPICNGSLTSYFGAPGQSKAGTLTITQARRLSGVACVRRGGLVGTTGSGRRKALKSSIVRLHIVSSLTSCR